MRERLVAALQGAFAGLESLGSRTEVAVGPGYPRLVNDAAVTGQVRAAAREVLGADSVLPMRPFLAAEDFAFLARRAPGAFFWLGAALPDPREHHHRASTSTKGCFPLGAAVLARSAAALLERDP